MTSVAILLVVIHLWSLYPAGGKLMLNLKRRVLGLQCVGFVFVPPGSLSLWKMLARPKRWYPDQSVELDEALFGVPRPIFAHAIAA